MNCKQGDLAIVVRSYAGNEGKIVTCVKYLGPTVFRNPKNVHVSLDAWEVDIDINGWDGTTTIKTFPDCYLKPLRGDLLNDELDVSKTLEAV